MSPAYIGPVQAALEVGQGIAAAGEHGEAVHGLDCIDAGIAREALVEIRDIRRRPDTHDKAVYVQCAEGPVCNQRKSILGR